MERGQPVHRRAPLGQRVIVRLDAGQLEFGVGLEKAEIRHRSVRIEHFAVDTIVIERIRALIEISQLDSEELMALANLVSRPATSEGLLSCSLVGDEAPDPV